MVASTVPDVPADFNHARTAVRLLQISERTQIVRRLKSGDVEAVAVAASGKNNEIHTAWFGWSAELVAPTQVLAARLMTDLRNNI